MQACSHCVNLLASSGESDRQVLQKSAIPAISSESALPTDQTDS